MIKHAHQMQMTGHETASAQLTDTAPVTEHIAPAPRISVQAFCETPQTMNAMEKARDDRRLYRAHVSMQMGGITSALEAYRNLPTPNVVVIESDNRAEKTLAQLDQLAEVCDAGTRVVLISPINDVTFYRELTQRGVSDYLVAPVGTIDIVRGICRLFTASDAPPVGRLIAVVGAKGGVGASTVAHNVAWAISRDLVLDSVVTDLDLAFGTAGLDYNQDPPQGVADAVSSTDRIDTALIDRLLSKCSDHLSLLAAPATLDRVYDFGADAFDAILDTLRVSIPCVVLDIPHQWSGWIKRVLVNADDVLVVAGADLASLRNAKNLVDMLRNARPNDRHPFYCLNQVGIPKRSEIAPADFTKALDDPPMAVIPFDPQLFSTASNNGQMIAEVSAKHKTAEMFLNMAQILTGRAEAKRGQRSGMLMPFVSKLMKRTA